MYQLLVPVSIGELYDKISILEIKLSFVGDNLQKKNNISVELDALRQVETTLNKPSDLDEETFKTLYMKLKEVNLRIWELEDEVRQYGKELEFGDKFIHCARHIHINNDLRAVVKRQINDLMRSQLVEEKLY